MSDYEAAQRRRDVVVGIFVIIGLTALGWMVFKFGDLPTAVTRMRSFEVYVQFPTAPGVQKDTPVRFAGYQIGRVTKVAPPKVRVDRNTQQSYHQTLVTLSINRTYTDIPCNVEVKLMTRGLGSSYIELKVDPDKLPAPPMDPNDPNSCFLKQGMLMQGSTGMTSEFFPEESQEKLSKLVEGIGEFIDSANDIIGDPNNQKNLRTIMTNLTKSSNEIPQAIAQATEMMKALQKTLGEFRVLATTGTGTLRSVDAKAQRLVVSLVDTSSELGKAAAQLRLALEKVNSGDGTAGRLINDGRLYENLLETSTQLNVLLEDVRELLDKVSEKGLRSVY